MMTVLFYAMTSLLTLQVILRFVFSTGFSWGEEVARFIFVWLMYFSIAYATRNQRHIRMAFFVQKFGDKGHKVFMIIADFIFLFFSVIVFYAAIHVVQSTFKYNDMAVTINVSLNIVYGAGALGFLLILLRVLQGIIWKIRHFGDELEVFENYSGKYTGADQMFLITHKERKLRNEDDVQQEDEK